MKAFADLVKWLVEHGEEGTFFAFIILLMTLATAIGACASLLRPACK
jgi:hypothetical protein